MSIAEPEIRTRRAVQTILGILLLIVGVLFAAAPVMAAERAAVWSGWILLAFGIIQLVVVLRYALDIGSGFDRIIPSLFWIALGLIILWCSQSNVEMLPYAAALWLAAYGIMRIIRSIGMRARRERRATQGIAIGILCIAIAVVVGYSAFVEAMHMIGIAVAVGAIAYGLMLVIDGGVRTPVETPLLVRRQDKEIAETQNAEYRNFEAELAKKKTRKY